MPVCKARFDTLSVLHIVFKSCSDIIGKRHSASEFLRLEEHSLIKATRTKRQYKFSEQRKSEIIESARDLIEERGLSHVSIKDVAAATGISRGALYYYYEDKDALVDAVLDDYIDDLMEALDHWERHTDGTGNRDKLRGIIIFAQHLVNERSYLRQDLNETENAGLYARFSLKVLERIVSKIGTHGSFSAFTGIECPDLPHLSQTLYLLIAGLTRYLRSHPGADIDIITEVVAHMLSIPLERQQA